MKKNNVFKELIVPVSIVAIIACMIVPIPPTLLDFLLVGNLLLALMLLVTTLYIPDPLRLSSLPTILLLATLYRLALNISTTRLILGSGEGGKAVEAFGSVVIGGNLAVGAVVFLIITLVQFIVIAKGSERVAEVSARFTLDALPGKQMSIDADVRSGLILPEMAKHKRAELQAESRFYGALDGAMKFVKGDAIAGIVITCINIIGGLAVGVLTEKLQLFEALNKYTMLTIGDGLLSQIPALLNSIAAGMVVTRVGRGDDSSLAHELLSQLGQMKRVKFIIAGASLSLALVPEMPHLPLFVLAGGLFISAIKTEDALPISNDIVDTNTFSVKAPPILEMLVNREIGCELYDMHGLATIIDRQRQKLFNSTGIIVPRPIFDLAETGVLYKAQIFMRGVLVDSTNSINNAPEALNWMAQVIDRVVIERRAEFIDDILTRKTLDQFDADAPELVSSVVPSIVSVTQLTEVLKALAKEGISIRNFDIILQAVAEYGPKSTSDRALLSEVRVALKRVISAMYIKEIESRRVISGYLLDPLLDLEFMGVEKEGKIIDPGIIDHLAQYLSNLKNEWVLNGHILLVSRQSRRVIKEFIQTRDIDIPVLAFEELSSDVSFEAVDTIEFSLDDAALGLAA